MAITTLQAQSAPANPLERRYRAWRYARAQWDMAGNDPEKPEGLTQEEDDAFCDLEHDALIAFFLEPAVTLQDVARKLRVFREQQAWEFNKTAQIIDQLRIDLHPFAFGFQRESEDSEG